MALVGKWTQYISEESETETQITTIKYPSPEAMGEDHPDIENAGKEIEKKVPKIVVSETIHEDVYVIVYAINAFKNIEYIGSPRNQMNICYRVYESKEVAKADPFDFIYENHLIKEKVDLSESNKNITEQAYDYLKITPGFEDLKQD